MIQVFETQARYVVTVASSNWLRCLTVVSNSQIEKVNKLMKAEPSLKDFDIYIYTYKTKAVMFGNYILAGYGSRHYHSSFVLASYDSSLETRLAQVRVLLNVQLLLE